MFISKGSTKILEVSHSSLNVIAMHLIFWMDESYNAQLILKEIQAH